MYMFLWNLTLALKEVKTTDLDTLKILKKNSTHTLGLKIVLNNFTTHTTHAYNPYYMLLWYLALSSNK